MANQLIGFEPDPNVPGAGTAKLSDGSSMYGRQSDFAPYTSMNQSSAMPVTQQPGLREIQDVSNLPLVPGTRVSQPMNPDGSMMQAGARAYGATPQDVAALQFAQATGRPNANLMDIIASKKNTAVPGRPAMTPGIEANQFFWRTQGQRSLEGARPIDEPRWGHVQKLAGQAVEAQARAQLAEGQATQDVATAQATAAQQLHQQMQAEQATREQQYQAQHQQLLSELDSASKSTPDQNRWFKEHGATGTIFAILGSMAQGYVQGLHGQVGPSMLERFINQDVNQQNMDLERRGAAAKNKLADLSQQWGSVEAGRAALRSSQLRLADAQLNQVAASAREPATKARVEAMKADLQRQIAESDFNLRQAAQGTSKVTQAGQYVQPTAARAGGVVTKYGPLAPGQPDEKAPTAEQMQKFGEFTDVRDRVISLAKQYGLNYDPATNRVTAPAGWSNPLGSDVYGESMRSHTRAASEQQQRLRAETDQIIPLYTHAQMGRVTEQDLEIARKNFYGENPAQTPHALNAVLQTVDHELKAWGGAVPNKERFTATRGIKREGGILEDEPLEGNAK